LIVAPGGTAQVYGYSSGALLALRAAAHHLPVAHFQHSIGVPSELVTGMRSTREWAAMEAVAHTLVYDCIISKSTTPATVRSVGVPTLVLDSTGSSDDLAGWAAAVAAELPCGTHRSLPGAWHSVPDEVLAPVLLEFRG
jgi:hypothetical protein